MEKIAVVRFAHSVHIAGSQETYIDTTKPGSKYEVFLIDDFRIRVTHVKTKKTVFSSLFNTISWEMAEKEKKKPTGKKPADREFEDSELALEESEAAVG